MRRKSPKIELRDLHPWDAFKARREIVFAVKLAARYGPIDQIERIIATWWFEGDRPFSVSLREESGRLRCLISLNAKSKDYLGSWPGSMRFTRLMWLLEACLETVEARENYEADDSPAIQVAYSPSPEVTVGSIAIASRSVYLTQKKIDRILSEQLSGPDSNPLTLAIVRDQDDSPSNLPGLIESDLDDLAASIMSEIGPVVRGSSRDEIGAWLNCAQYLGRLIVRLAHFAAAYDSTPDWSWRQARLYERQNFAMFLAEDWPTIYGDWRAALARGRAENREPGVAGEAIKNVFHRLGITILSEPQGASILQLKLVDQPA